MATIRVETGPGLPYTEMEVLAAIRETAERTNAYVYQTRNKLDGTTLVEIVKYERIPSIEVMDQETLQALRRLSHGRTLQETLRTLVGVSDD